MWAIHLELDLIILVDLPAQNILRLSVDLWFFVVFFPELKYYTTKYGKET